MKNLLIVLHAIGVAFLLFAITLGFLSCFNIFIAPDAYLNISLGTLTVIVGALFAIPPAILLTSGDYS